MPRPIGLGPDIGAFELAPNEGNPAPGTLYISKLANANQIAIWGRPGQVFELQASLGFGSWTTLARLPIKGAFETFQDPWISRRMKFYRAQEISP